MSIRVLRHARILVPRALRAPLKGALRFLPATFKHAEEIQYWRGEWIAGRFDNSHYKRIMLGMAGEADDSFISGKIVADFGCGPMGSLSWATLAKERIGIDVLASAYSQFDIRSHGMTYVTSTERTIPLPSDFIDVMFTVNAMDHVSHFGRMCNEILRILAVGGMFIGSFNLGEPRTLSEPQTLTEDMIDHKLLRYLEVLSRRTAPAGEVGNVYKYFSETCHIKDAHANFLWVCARKPV